jgi:hypothetical protein
VARCERREDFGLGVGVGEAPRLAGWAVSQLALMLKKDNIKFVNGCQSHLVNITSVSYSRHVW